MVHSVNLLIAVAAFGAASTVAAPLTARDFEVPTPQTRGFAGTPQSARFKLAIEALKRDVAPELETRELEARRRRGSGRSSRSRSRGPSLNTVNNVLDVANTALPIVNTFLGQRRELSEDLEARDYEELEARRGRGGGRSGGRSGGTRGPSLNTVGNVLDVANTALPFFNNLFGKRQELSEDLEARDYEDLEARRRRGGGGGRRSRRPSINTVNNVIDAANNAIPLVGTLLGQPEVQQRELMEELDAREVDDLEAREFEDLEARRKMKAGSPTTRPATPPVPPVKATAPQIKVATPPVKLATPPVKLATPPAKPATPLKTLSSPKAGTPRKRPASQPGQPAGQQKHNKRPANGQARSRAQQQGNRRHSTTNQKINTALHGVDTLINGIQTWQSLTQPAAPPAPAPVDPAAPVEGVPPVARSIDEWEQLEAREDAYDELD